MKHNGNINEIPLISYKVSRDVFEKRYSLRQLCYIFHVRINLDNNMPDLLSKFLMRIHVTNGRRMKELRRNFGHRMDRNAYISLRAWHPPTLILNPPSISPHFSMISLLDLGPYMTSFFNSLGGQTRSYLSGCITYNVFRELQ